MKLYKVTLENDDGGTFTADVPANSKKDARKKADGLYGDEVVVTKIEEQTDDSVDGEGDSGNADTGDAETTAADSKDGGKVDASKEGGGSTEPETTDEPEDGATEESDAEPQEEHWWFKPRGRVKSGG